MYLWSDPEREVGVLSNLGRTKAKDTWEEAMEGPCRGQTHLLTDIFESIEALSQYGKTVYITNIAYSVLPGSSFLYCVFPKFFFLPGRGVCGIWCLFSVCHSGCRSQWRHILHRRLVDQIPLRSTWPSWNIAADTVKSDIKVTLNYDSNVICCICMSIYINLVTDECDLSRCCT